MRIALLCTAVVAVATGCVRPTGQPDQFSSASITNTQAQVARSRLGMVASASKLATAVGAMVLAQGGNAVDAAAATSFALAVTEPNMSGLGGRTSIVIRTPDGEIYGVDGVNQVPGGYQAGAPAGYATAAIPGVPAAIGHIVEKYGSWKMADIVAPAIRLANEGYALPPQTAAAFESAATDLAQFEASRRYFMKPDGSLYSAGDLFVQKDLARTLRAIAEGGVQAFYRGWIADSVHADMTRAGGFITRAEMAAYEAVPSILVRGSYRGHEIVSNYDPASGQAVIEALQIMEQLDLSRMSPIQYGSVLGQAMQLALSDRSRRFGSREESADHITSKEFAIERARAVGIPGPPRIPPGALDEPPWWLRPDQDHTTHFSVVDSKQMVVSMTQSLGPSMGTRLAASGAGFLFATRLGAVPGSRPASTISPTIVMDSLRRPLFVLGAAGDARIITAVIQTIARVVDHKLSLAEAMSAPRMHPMGAASLRIEHDARAGWPADAARQFSAIGFQVDTAPGSYFARVHAVAIDNHTGIFTGVAEPRGAGSAVGVLSVRR
jgi:gamma-glutamyltranspeptidase/glutathione hydrolase